MSSLCVVKEKRQHVLKMFFCTDQNNIINISFDNETPQHNTTWSSRFIILPNTHTHVDIKPEYYFLNKTYWTCSISMYSVDGII